MDKSTVSRNLIWSFSTFKMPPVPSWTKRSRTKLKQNDNKWHRKRKIGSRNICKCCQLLRGNCVGSVSARSGFSCLLLLELCDLIEFRTWFPLSVPSSHHQPESIKAYRIKVVAFFNSHFAFKSRQHWTFQWKAGGNDFILSVRLHLFLLASATLFFLYSHVEHFHFSLMFYL